ncbi:MAG: VCBS repeat-containing protein [Bacteroidaceae bacterium]|nr:VCBS repeat-containing protein [Bacteroidaceae bacterium]
MKALKISLITALLLCTSLSVKGAVGNTLQDPIELGTKSQYFTYSSGRIPMMAYTDTYGITGPDMFMRITLSVPMEVEIEHHDLNIVDSYLHVLNSEGTEIACDDNGNGLMAYLNISLSAGTYYFVSEGKGRTGYMGITIKGQPIVYSQEYGYSLPPNISSSQSGAVGALGGSFNVSAMGAATYTIPIELPIGVGGLQPQIAITYNSQAGNGLCGYGTNVTGFSSITRGPKDIYHDNTAQGIKYLANDALYLDGVRLIKTQGTEGQEGAVYQLESDPFTTVTIHGSCTSTNNNISFEVNRHDGLTYYYGTTSDSRLSYSKGNSNRIYSWHLNRVEQPNGNYMTYSYQKNNYCIYPDKISYGGPGYANNTQLNVVEFVYETRSDTIPIRFDGKNGRMNWRLKTITSKTDGNVYRSYNLSYNTTGDGTAFKFSRLVSVTEKNGQNEALPAVQFNWSYLPAPTNDANTISVANPNVNSHFVSFTFPDQRFISGDMNNDGITDIIGVQGVQEKDNNGHLVSKTFVNVYESERASDGTVSFNSGTLYKLDPSVAIGSLSYSGVGGLSTLDFDGDGYNDLLIPRFTKIQNNHSVIFELLMHDGGHYAISYPISTRHLSMPKFATGDLDNDGKEEIIYAELVSSNDIGNIVFNVIKCTGNSGNLSCSKQQIASPNSVYPGHLYIADMNGNGLNDIVSIPPYGYSVFWNQGGQTISSSFAEQYNSSSSQADVNIQDKFYLGDFNGDGLTDFLSNTSENWYFYINNGNGGFQKLWACTLDGILEQSFTDRDDDKYHCEILDFDNDGKSDIVVTKADYKKKYNTFLGIEYGTPWGEFKKTHTYWLRSTGTSLEVVHHATSNKDYDAYPWRYITGDFDGDGRVELINYGYDCSHGENESSDPVWHKFKTNNLTLNRGKVTSIVGDFGASTSITYSTLSDAAVYSKGSATTYPAPKYTLPITVVKSVTQGNGAAGSNTSSYSYSGLRIHLKGKGVLGFTSSQVNNSTLGTTVKTEITGWNNTFYVPNATKVTTTISGSGSAYTQNTLSIVDKGDKKFFAYPSQTVETDFDGKSVTTTRTYNTANGYITNETVTYATNLYKSVTYSDYVLAGNVYKPQTVVTSQRHPDDTAPFNTTTKYTYNTFAGWVLQVIANDGKSKPLTTQYTYDSWGNLASEKKIVGGVSYPTTYYTYDYTDRFPVRIYTNPASTEQLYTYDIWGNVLTERNYINSGINNTITHTYDNWGNLVRTQIPGSGEVSYVRGWGDSPSKRFFVLEQGTSRPWVKTWYDNQGREVMSESVGSKNALIYTNATYNNKGLRTGLSETNGTLTLSHSFAYDARGRITREDHPGNSIITYSYGSISDGRTKTVTDNGRATTYTYDVIGNLKKVQSPLSSTLTHWYSSNGNVKKTVSNGVTWTFGFDDCGNRTSIVDPDAGTTTYTYDAFGREILRIDGRGNSYPTYYDNFGRVTYDGTTTFTYGTSGNGQSRLVNESNGQWTKSYTYDAYGRVTQETMVKYAVSTKSMSYHYNADGLLTQKDYPNNTSAVYAYDSYGNCTNINFNNGSMVWNLTGNNGKTTTSSVKIGNSTPFVRTTQLDNYGNIQSRTMTVGNTTVQNDSYVFNPRTGNLTSRTLTGHATENFTYDNLDRLMREQSSEIDLQMSYTTKGNINEKTNVGQYHYPSGNAHAHAVDYIDVNPYANVPEFNQYIEYDYRNKPDCLAYSIDGNDYWYTMEHGPNHQRVKSRLENDGELVREKFYWNEYEEFIANGATVSMYWIEAPDGLAGLYVDCNNGDYYSYVATTDHLGSLTGLLEYDGTQTYGASYDAWGKRTITCGYIQVEKGFTGHEHIDELGLINMNGRMYDPLQGVFLSPDPYIQNPSNPQNYNRYSYCLNNPLKYTDPTGELFGIDDAILGIAIGAVIGGVSGYMIGDANNASGWEMAGYIAGGALIGGLSSWAGVYMAQDLGAVVAGMNVGSFSGTMFAGMSSGWKGDAMMLGYCSGLISGTLNGVISGYLGSIYGYDPVGLINGMLADGAMGSCTGAVVGGVTSLCFGGDFWDGAKSGLLSGAVAGMISGGIRGCSNAETLGVDRITGGTLEERAQAWANYYGLKGDMYHYASMEDLDALCMNKDYKYVKQYDGIAKINRADNKLLAHKIDGLTSTDGKRVYLSGHTIRHARFGAGWAKGTFFHETYHTFGPNQYSDEVGAYSLGYCFGRKSYYRHNRAMMKANGISKRY